MKHFLCLETSTEKGSLGLFRIENKKIKELTNKEWVCVSEAKNKIQHSQKLPLEIEIALKESSLKLEDLDFFVVGVGPGRFTGVRTACAIIKTLSFSFKKPCYPIDSLKIVSQHFKGSKDSVCIAFNAFKNSVYFSEFQKGQCLTPSQVMSYEKWLEYMIQNKKSFCVGDMQNFYEIPEELKSICEFVSPEIKAEHLAQIVQEEFDPQKLTPWFQLEPKYLRSVAD